MTAPSESICILRLSAIGDVCNAVAVVQEIQRVKKHARITWIIGKAEYALVSSLPGIDFYVFDKSRGVSEYLKLRRELNEVFDVLLHMQLSLRANALALLVRARKKIGFPRHLSKELHGLVVNSRCDMPERPHVVDGFKAFARALGLPDFQLRWSFPLDSKDAQYVEQFHQGTAPCLVIAPVASNFERNWLPERYAALASYAHERGFHVYVCSGPAARELEFVEQILAACKVPVENVSGKFSLSQMLYFLRLASVLVCPDTGPAHMAVSQGTPVVGLYAHSNPERTGPYTYREYVVSVYHDAIASQTRSNTTPSWGERAKGDHLMALIELDDVCRMLDRVVAGEGIGLSSTRSI